MPIAPEFDNPPTAPNYFPYFSDSEPVQERTVTAAPSSNTMGLSYVFVVSVGDQNLGDTLYVRWVADYPPFAPNVTKVLSDGPEGLGLRIPPSTPQAQSRPPIRFEVQCSALAPGMQHRVVLIVADRPFLKAETFSGDFRYTRVGNRDDESPVTYPVVTGWNLVCPS